MDKLQIGLLVYPAGLASFCENSGILNGFFCGVRQVWERLGFQE